MMALLWICLRIFLGAALIYSGWNNGIEQGWNFIYLLFLLVGLILFLGSTSEFFSRLTMAIEAIKQAKK